MIFWLANFLLFSPKSKKKYYFDIVYIREIFNDKDKPLASIGGYC